MPVSWIAAVKTLTRVDRPAHGVKIPGALTGAVRGGETQDVGFC